MCEESCERSDVWLREVRKARREHRCDACDRTIARGHRYAITRSLYDGRWSQFKHCGRCDAIYLALVDRSEWDDYVDPLLNCGSVWVDPPEHIAALAVVTEDEASEILGGEA